MTASQNLGLRHSLGLCLVILCSRFGLQCAEDVDECQRVPCRNGGTCLNQRGNYTCICMNGWTGNNCTINIDDCGNHPCMNGGTCIDKVGSYSCDCPKGKTGLRCHLDDACISNPCQSGAVCETSPLDGSYMCSCPPGMNGTDCTVDINECIETARNPCEQGGICENTIGSFTCKCRKGLSGPRCEININECQSSPCQNEGTCLDNVGMFTCLCMDGFTGITCETAINECAGTSCANGGTCQDKVGYFECLCLPGYTGIKCETEILECSSNPCQYGANCTELVNGFRCQCPPGTSGNRCEVNNNQCSRNDCRNGASCLQGVNFTCICLPGYTGRLCETNIFECSSNPCQNGGTCFDLVNGYRCDCASGFNGTLCTSNINECNSSPCQNGGSCTDGIDRYDCQCPSGYGGLRCESDVNECNSNPCQHGGTCLDWLGGYSCHCPAGFSGMNCEANEDDCSPNPCQNNGKCIDGIQDYSCVCEHLYTGRNCLSLLSPCTVDLCQNRGQCEPDSSSTGFICRCLPGFTGERCSADVDECATGNPCHNGGTCRNSFGSFTCLCPPGYSDQYCDINPNDCASGPCLNGGTCVDGLNNYTCQCVPGYDGYNCQFDIDECLSSPCINGATCHDYVNSYTCTCAAGFSGTNCHVNDDDCTSSSCLYGGTCVDGVNVFSCRCPSGYSGSNCQQRLTACDSNPCLNDGSCISSGQTFQCFCAYGWTGQNCNKFVDWCNQTAPVCQNGGTCHQLQHQFQCACPLGWTGQLCDVRNVSCAVEARNRGVNVSSLCHNGGTCYDVGSMHQCHCINGYEGTYCETKTNQCASLPCQNGATCSNLSSGYRCSCIPGFTGVDCETNIDECSSSPCLNSGTCHDLISSFHCSCPPGTSGVRCESNPDDCHPGSCQNGGTCFDRINGFTCSCPPGFTGSNCQGDIDECLSSPCVGPGVLACIQGTGTYTCLCKQGWSGPDCRFYVSQCANGSGLCQHGGTCVDLGGPFNASCSCPPGYAGTVCQEPSCKNNPCQNKGVCNITNSHFECHCPPDFSGATCNVVNNNTAVCDNCREKAGNNKCDPECDAYICNYENYECSYNSSIYKNCNAIKNSIPCYALINNGVCNSECNNEGCLYDGWDCKNQTVCNPIYDAYCKSHYKDGHCDQGCNNEECGWDGQDCTNAEHKYAKDVLVIIVLVSVEEFRKDSAAFLRNLSLLLHGTVVIKKDENGNDMIYSWPDDYGYIARRKRNSVLDFSYDLLRNTRSTLTGTKFYARLDNINCQAQCFPNAELAAEFLAQSMRQGYNPGYPLYSVNSEPDDGSSTSGPPTLPVVVSVVSIIVIVVVLAIVITVSRKRGYGKTWFPEGFCISVAHSTPDGQDSSKRVITSSSSSDAQCSTAESVTTASDSWSDEESTYPLKTKRHKLEKEDSREWTRMHLEAAGTIPKPAILAFTPPQSDQHEIRNINVRGPGGLTPLMLASMASSEPYVGYDGHDGTSIITDLINDGASIHCKTDHTGETPLHLAARYSRSDAAKRLLDAGADPNVPDNLGRTPLHAAVTADAVGVFQILLRHRMTIVNARMKDGTTPLILAVRLAIEGMVEELINAEADIGAADDLGKTALHWAAAVNNVGAAVLLLRHGANKDAQDDHNQTPLFIAAREGSRDVALLLLQNSASIDIPDHVEHLPRDIALDRCHHDIVLLLDNFSYNLASDGVGGLGVGASGGVMSSYMSQGPKSKQKRPSKKQRLMKDTECHKIDHCLQFPPHFSGQFVHLPLEGTKKSKRRSAATCFAAPSMSPRGCVRGAAVGNMMDLPNRTVEYPPSYDQSCQLRRQQYMAQAALPSLSGAFVDAGLAFESTEGFHGNMMMIGGDITQEQVMAAHSWFQFEDNQNPFATGHDPGVQWLGHASTTVPESEGFGAYDDAYLYQQQEHSYRDETGKALDVLESTNMGVFHPEIGAVNQNFQFDGYGLQSNSHVDGYQMPDHEFPHGPKAGQMQGLPENQNSFLTSVKSAGAVQNLSACVKNSAVVGHGRDPSSAGNTSKNPSFPDNSLPSVVQSFLHPGMKYPPEDTLYRQTHAKPIKHVLPLSQYPFPQHNIQNCPNDVPVPPSGATADSARSSMQKPSFPTPPSQHGHSNDTPPQQLSSCMSRELYPTPSPDSLGPWSNSPTQSAKSDWLDKVKNSPHRVAVPQAQSVGGNVKEEPSFFV